MKRILLTITLLVSGLTLFGQNQTPLTSAAINGDVSGVKSLLSRGADINEKNKFGFSALMLAVQNGHENVVDALLAEGPDVNAQDVDTGWTALRIAAKMDNLAILNALLKNGASISVKDKNGWTPIMVAAINGKLQSVNALRKAGATLTNDLVYSAALGQIDEVRKFLANGADINAKNETGRSPLASASANGNVDVVKLLLDKSADANSEGKDGLEVETALMLAASRGHIEAVKALLSKGADLKLKSARGWTAFMLAVDAGQSEVVKFLLEHGADPNETAPEACPALLVAVPKHPEVVKILLDARANVNATKEANGYTALMLGAYWGNLESVRLLLQYGARVSLRNKQGLTALQVAEGMNQDRTSIIELLSNPESAKNPVKKTSEAATKGAAADKMTKAEWRRAVAPFDITSTQYRLISLSEAAFKTRFGKPVKEQKVGDMICWYFRCSDGDLQVVIHADFLPQQGVMIKSINEY